MVYKKKILSLIILTIFSLRASKEGVISKEYIQKFLPKNPFILEAGAHIGIDTMEMATFWPEATIFAFEPVPFLFKKLQLNNKDHKHVSCFSEALSNKTGTAVFYISSGSSDGSSSLLQPISHLSDHPDVHFTQSTQVKTITLQEWAEKNNINHIDFMWLDMQGAELDMLKAAGTILDTVKVIYTEVSLKETYQNVPLYPEIKKWLEKKGFTVVREELPWQDMGNVLFVRI